MLLFEYLSCRMIFTSLPPRRMTSYCFFLCSHAQLSQSTGECCEPAYHRKPHKTKMCLSIAILLSIPITPQWCFTIKHTIMLAKCKSFIPSFTCSSNKHLLAVSYVSQIMYINDLIGNQINGNFKILIPWI